MAIHITSSSKLYRPRPASRFALKILIQQELEEQGPDAYLNHIDTSLITDMSYLFENFYIRNIKIDEWDTSNVTDMRYMFHNCYDFKGDISKWDFSNVRDTSTICRRL